MPLALPRLFLGLLLLVPGLALAQPTRGGNPPEAEAAAGLPPVSSTLQAVALPGRTLNFAASAGAVEVDDAAGKPQAELAVTAYELQQADPASRPVTFALNGGPGSSSAWLQLGLLGPWRLPMDAAAVAPGAPPVLQPNADTWLDFTDLVFIDPAGTGFSRFLAGGEDVRRRFFSVGGDIESLAVVIRRWLVQNHRLASPKFLLGESYGGFRAPHLVRALAERQGIGIGGLILVSPALDFGGRSGAFDPMDAVYDLPSMVATVRAARGRAAPGSLEDVEAYAEGDYLRDLLRGARDPQAVARRSARVADLTGLDPALVQRRRGVIDVHTFLTERQPGRIGSVYDASRTQADPYPEQGRHFAPDPILDGLNAAFVSAMHEVDAKLHWQPDANYVLLDRSIARSWDYGRSNMRPEAVSALRESLASDPQLRVLVAHGMFDLVTPYFRTRLMLDQIAPGAGAERVRLLLYPGGHMFYSDNESRAAFRVAAQQLYQIEAP